MKNRSELHRFNLCPKTIFNNNTAIKEEFELAFTKEEIKLQHEEEPNAIVYKHEAGNNTITCTYLRKT
jgi:hypothetical protein